MNVRVEVVSLVFMVDACLAGLGSSLLILGLIIRDTYMVVSFVVVIHTIAIVEKILLHHYLGKLS